MAPAKLSPSSYCNCLPGFLAPFESILHTGFRVNFVNHKCYILTWISLTTPYCTEGKAQTPPKGTKDPQKPKALANLFNLFSTPFAPCSHIRLCTALQMCKVRLFSLPRVFSSPGLKNSTSWLLTVIIRKNVWISFQGTHNDPGELAVSWRELPSRPWWGLI